MTALRLQRRPSLWSPKSLAGAASSCGECLIDTPCINFEIALCAAADVNELISAPLPTRLSGRAQVLTGNLLVTKASVIPSGIHKIFAIRRDRWGALLSLFSVMNGCFIFLRQDHSIGGKAKRSHKVDIRRQARVVWQQQRCSSLLLIHFLRHQRQ